MSDLPLGWAERALDEIVAPGRPVCYGILMPKENVADGVPYVKVRDFRDGVIDVEVLHRTTMAIASKYVRSVLRGGDVLVSIRGTYGRVAIVPDELTGSNITQDTARISPALGVDPSYIMYFTRSSEPQQYFRRVARGVAVKGVNIGDLRKLPVRVAPAGEQRRLVAALEEQFSRIDAAERLLDGSHRRSRRLRSTVLSSILDGRWPLVRIGDVAAVGGGATPKRSDASYWDGGTIPWVTSGQLTVPFVREPAALITEKALRETSVKIWPKHTLLVALYGEGKTRGHCSELLLDATTNQACAAIVLKDDSIDRAYLKLFFAASYDAHRRLASGGVQPNLSLGLIKDLAFPLPPVEEQRRIVTEIERRLSVADSLVDALDRAKRRSATLRRSILELAFKGRLVPHDPADEPASELLERVAAAHGHAPDASRKRRKAPV